MVCYNADGCTPLEITDTEETKSLEKAQETNQENKIGEPQNCGFDKVSTIVKQELLGVQQREIPCSNGYKKSFNYLCIRTEQR